MARDFRAELADTPCWDASTEAIFRATGAPAQDRVLQNREELIAFCEWIDRQAIRSYLEIGVWTGRLVSTLQALFGFDRVAAADLGWARSLGLPIRLPFGARWFEGSSHSEAFMAWRAELGHVDLVVIDGDHTEDGVRADFEIQRRFPHGWLVFHDITGGEESTAGVRALWDSLDGDKHEIVRPHLELGRESRMGIGIWRARDTGVRPA